MADFLPIGLGRDDDSIVTGLKEITPSDSIPEIYLSISNTTAKWNASALQSFQVSAVTPTNAYVLTWDSALNAWVPKAAGAAGTNAAELQGEPICATTPTQNQILAYTGSEWCPSTLVITGGGGGGTVDGTGLGGRIVQWSDTETIGYWEPSINNDRILKWNSTSKLPVDSGYTNTEAGWNANKIQGVSACPDAPTQGSIWVFNQGLNAWCPSNVDVSNATKIQSRPVPAPSVDDYVLTYDSGTNAYVWEARVKATTGLVAGKLVVADATGSIVNYGYTKDDAEWNANKIQGVSAVIPVVGDDGSLLKYNHTQQKLEWSASAKSAASAVTASTFDASVRWWKAKSGDVPRLIPLLSSTGIPANTNAVARYNYGGNSWNWVNITGTVLATVPPGTNLTGDDASKGVLYVPASDTGLPEYESSVGIYPNYFVVAGSGTNESQLMITVSASPNHNGVWLVTSGGQLVPAYLPDYLLRYFGTGTSAYPAQAPQQPELLPAQGQVIYLDYDNERWTNTGQLLIRNTGVIVNNNVSATGTVQASTVSATNYLNLPSATIEWYQAHQAESVIKYVKNNNAYSIPIGSPVTVTSVTGDTINVAILSSVNTHVPEAAGFSNHVFGLAQNTILAGSSGYIVTEGLVVGDGTDHLNTTAFAGGDILYVSSNGHLNNTRPPAPYESHPVGYVVRSQSINGSIYVKIDSVPELNDIVGFDLTSSLINGDIITYDTTTSTFINKQTVTVSGQGKFGSVSATTLNADSAVVKNTLDIASGIYTAPVDSRLYVQGKSYFQNQLTVNSNMSVTGTASATTVSATNYSNLPSSTIVWASAGYATLAGSATSANIATSCTTAAPKDAEYLVINTNGVLTNERVIEIGAGLLFNDDGAGSNYTITADNLSPIWAVGSMFNASLETTSPTLDGDLICYSTGVPGWTVCPSSIFAGGGGGAPTNAQYLTLATDGTLSEERVFVAGAGLGSNDAGANGNFTLSANYTSAIWQPSATFGTINQTVRTLGNFRVDQTLSAATVSATTYLNLPSGTAIWNANKLQGYDVTSTAPTAGQLLTYDGSKWSPSSLSTTSITTNEVQSTWVPAVAMYVPSTAGALVAAVETANAVMLRSLDFDATTQEYAHFSVKMPKSWNEGTINYNVVWDHSATSVSYGVVWRLDAQAVSDGDSLNTAWTTGVQVSDTGGSVTTAYHSPDSAALTVAGTPTANDLVLFRISRIPSDAGDTFGSDASLLGVLIKYTIDSATDL